MKKPWARERMILKVRGVTLAPLFSFEDICMRRVIAMERKERKLLGELLAQGFAGGTPEEKIVNRLKSLLSSYAFAVYGEEEKEDLAEEAMLAEFNRMRTMTWTLTRDPRQPNARPKLRIGEKHGKPV